MKISEVNVVPIKPDEGLIAFASCVLDDCYYIGSIAVFTKLGGGYRIVFPTKKIGERHMHYHHPINREIQAALLDAISDAMKNLY